MKVSSGLILLVFIAILCVFGLLFNMFGSAVRERQISLRGTNKSKWVTEADQPFNEDHAADKTNHLIMVAGHSVIVAGNLEDAETDENVWYLLDYQKGKGLPQAILAHIKNGISEATKDPHSLLIFSGGETRGKTGPVNEGSSYFRVADALDLWGDSKKSVRARTVTEEFATDSFQNLMFSICRFKEVTGQYPQKITAVSFSFKQHRFEEMHSKALLWPSDRFHYVGMDPPVSTGFNLEEASKGELENAAQLFEDDPYGCLSLVLQQKRHERNPFKRTPPYVLTCPEMRDLLRWCGPGLFRGKLPWAR